MRRPTHGKGRRAGRLRWAAPALILCLCGALPTVGLYAQGAKGKKGPAEAERVVGKISSLERKGKTVTLTVAKEAGGSLDVLLTPKLRPEITAKGDASLFQQGRLVASDSLVMSNGELFGRKFSVYLSEAPREPLFSKDPQNEGVWHLCGQVVAVEPASITLNYGGSIKKVSFEQGGELEVTAYTQDAELIVEGSAVELEGNARAGRFITQRVAVTRDKPLTADELAGANDKKGAKTKAAPAARGGRKAGKDRNEDSEAEPPPQGNDPFGVLGGKDGKGSDGAKPKSGSKSAESKNSE
ncbi:MAG: hypothetical protein ACT4QC_21185 [Planctomycetaceae bacterium]